MQRKPERVSTPSVPKIHHKLILFIGGCTCRRLVDLFSCVTFCIKNKKCNYQPEIPPTSQMYYLKVKHLLGLIFLLFPALHHLHHPHAHTNRGENIKSPFPRGRFSAFELHTPTNWPTAWCRNLSPENQQRGGERRLVRHNRNGSRLNDVLSVKKFLISLENSLPISCCLSSKTYCIHFFRKAQLDNYTKKYKYH